MKYSSGFSLAELVISISIIILISTMILFNAPRFNRTMALNRAAREVASTLRLAQARATQVRALNGGSFPTNYGVQFKESSNEFVLFSDKEACSGGANNNHYDVGCPAEDNTAVPFRLGGGIVISQLKGPELPLPQGECPELSGSQVYSILNVLFFRPDPSIKVTCGPNEDGKHMIGTYGAFRIYIKSPDTSLLEKQVHVWLTGQISIK